MTMRTSGAVLCVLLMTTAPALAQDAPSGLAQAAAQGTQRAEQINQQQADQQQYEQPDSEFPVIGSDHLLKSLDELDRPLSPEEITAYGAAVQSQMPMTPELIRDYKRRVNESQKAAAQPATGFRPKAISDQVQVSLEAAAQTTAIKTSPGTISNLAFFDRTGKAWPIASYGVGRPNAFQVYAMQEGSNQLMITPLLPHAFTNLTVSLVGEDRPLIIDVETNEKVTQYRRDYQVDGLGPNAHVSTAVSAPPSRASNQVMMAFVQGAGIPQNATRLSTDEPSVSAWRYGKDLYIRTTSTLLSPSWTESQTGPGSVHAYKLKPTPVALISSDGSVKKVRIFQ
ncbi:intracellular multiplication protein IcmK [Martelella mediterranea]|uniref:Intracellular multiplication protein IcmK n=3 Tax=Martelella mediterranea TaxID=293089 RepID=A0A4R3NLU4_9HYPH|nr:hypothetical protein Mame_04963 [Martelella mediterranea DSM 17316]TCT36045.1 intracellular multiplication protein IcmK [Martelella mediterranea]